MTRSRRLYFLLGLAVLLLCAAAAAPRARALWAQLPSGEWIEAAAVSYTHLDVYKRQGHMHRRCGPDELSGRALGEAHAAPQYL